MSLYQTVATEFTHVQDLIAACDAAGVPFRHYPEQDGVYRKWTNRGGDKNYMGHVRGSDAELVIHGGLDSTARRYCGDTAFVRDAQGKLQAMIDVAHGNAPARWRTIQNEYAYQGVTRQAKKQGLRVQRLDDAPGGSLRCRLIVPERSASRQVGRDLR